MEDKRTGNTVERPFQVIPTRFSLNSAPETVLDWLWVHPFITPPLSLSPPLPRQLCDPKQAIFHPFCSKCNLVWSVRGEVVNFTDITGKFPASLISLSTGRNPFFIVRFGNCKLKLQICNSKKTLWFCYVIWFISLAFPNRTLANI